MKFNLNVNQLKALEFGIGLPQSIVLDLLTGASTWAKAMVVDGDVYYWVARQKICDELPILRLKPDTAYRHLKTLREAGLIEHKKQGIKDLVRLTNLGKSFYSEQKRSTKVGNKSEFCETSTENHYVGNKSETGQKLGNKSEPLCRKQIRKNSEINPTYYITKDHISNDQRENNSLTPIEKDFTPCETSLVHLRRNGHTPLDKNELQIFVDHYIGTGELKKDWNAVYRKWVVQQRRNFDKQKTFRSNGNDQTNQSASRFESPADRALRKSREILSQTDEHDEGFH